MENRKKKQKKPAKKKDVEVGIEEKCEPGPSGISTKTHTVGKSRQIRNTSMKLFENDSSSLPSTPDPFSDDGEYGNDENYNPGYYDDNIDSTSTLSDHPKQRGKKHVKKPFKDNATRSQGKCNSESGVSSISASDAGTEDFSDGTEVCESDDSAENTNSTSEASSDESIFDIRKRKKKEQSSSLGSKFKRPKIASADQSTDTLSLESEALLNNLETLESSSVLPDPAVLDDISIYSRSERGYSHPNPQIQGLEAAEEDHAAENNHAPANLPAVDNDVAAQRRSPDFPAPDPRAAEGNPAPANLPALNLDAAAQRRSSDSPAPDPRAAEGNPGPAILPALDLDATAQRHPPSTSVPPDLDTAVRNLSPDSIPTLDTEVVAERGLPSSPVPDPDAAETNSASSSPSVLNRETFVQCNPSICNVLEQEAAEGNSAPDRLPEIDSETNRRPSTPPLMNYDWEHTNTDIPSFEFDDNSAGVQFEINPGMTVMEIFNKILNTNMVDYIVTCTNTYGRALCEKTRPATRNSRSHNFRDTNREEILKFFGLCLLMGQVKIPQKRKNFTYSDPLYFHPIFSYVISARRFEQILRCIYVSDLESKGKYKIEKFINAMTKSFRECYKPYKELSLDESLLLFRGRLAFRQYIKSKKARYGIKFFELTTSDGYVLNISMYSGKDTTVQTGKKTEKIVLHLMRPYLLKGHKLYMDNYYNSVSLSQKLIDLKTHTTGTLRSNRKENPKDIVKKKLKKNQHVWVRKNKVYVSKWVDKRPVLMVTTSVHPRLIEVQNRFQQRKIKPAEVAEYNEHMSGIDRADQMISYYSSPRKSLRWYKKVMFHLLDVAVWNTHFIFKKYCQTNCNFLLFREELIRRLLDLPADLTVEQLILARSKYDNRRRGNALLPVRTIEDNVGSSRVHGHWPEKIPVQEGSNKTSRYLKCKMCTKKKVRKETCLRCKGCPEKPALCALCFEEWHKEE